MNKPSLIILQRWMEAPAHKLAKEERCTMHQCFASWQVVKQEQPTPPAPLTPSLLQPRGSGSGGKVHFWIPLSVKCPSLSYPSHLQTTLIILDALATDFNMQWLCKRPSYLHIRCHTLYDPDRIV